MSHNVFTSNFFSCEYRANFILLFDRIKFFSNVFSFFYFRKDLYYLITVFYNSYLTGVAYFCPKIRSLLLKSYYHIVYDYDDVYSFKKESVFLFTFFLEQYLLLIFFCQFYFYSKPLVNDRSNSFKVFFLPHSLSLIKDFSFNITFFFESIFDDCFFEESLYYFLFF